MELLEKLGTITYPIGYAIENTLKPDPFLPSPENLNEWNNNDTVLRGGTYVKAMYRMVGNHFLVGLLVGLALVFAGLVSVKPAKAARRVYRRRRAARVARRTYTRKK